MKNLNKPARNNISNHPTRVYATFQIDILEGYDAEDVIDELVLDEHIAVDYFELTELETHPLNNEEE